MNLKQFFMPLSGLALISLASPSHAGDKGLGWDYKTLPGAACQPQIGAQAGDFERYPFSIRNVSESGGTVICPMVRDTVHSTNLDNGVVVTPGVRCTFFTVNYKGDQQPQVEPSEVRSLDVDREVQYFSVQANPGIDLEGVAQGYYALQCTLPSGGQCLVMHPASSPRAPTTASNPVVA